MAFGRSRHYKSAEAEAKAAKRGLWQGGFTRPSDWREREQPEEHSPFCIKATSGNTGEAGCPCTDEHQAERFCWAASRATIPRLPTDSTTMPHAIM